MKDTSPQDLNSQLMSAIGWKWNPKGDKYGPICHPWALGKERHPGMDFIGDLNATHMAERQLTKQQCADYEVILREVVAGKAGFWYVPHKGEVFEIAHATALQRTEALLKVFKLQ